MSGPIMRKAIFVLIVLLPLAVFGQYVSYWFQGWQRQGNARDAQEYFMVPGTGIYFTHAPTNRVIINAYGTNVVNTNYVLKAGDTMTGTLTNVSDLIIIRGSNQVATLTFEVPNPSVPGNFIQAILQFSTNNVFSISSVSNYIKAPTYITKVYGDGGGLTNLNFTTTGLTITQYMTDFTLGQITNVYSNGLLVANGLYVAPVTPLLGAGGDSMLGAGGDSISGAGG